MTTLMVGGAGRARNLQDLVFMVQRKGLGAGVVSGLRACVFLQMLLDLPRERTWKMGPIKRMEEFDPVFFQETFRFSQGEFTEILSSMRDMDGDLLVDANGDPRLLRRIGKTPKEYMRCWADSALMILLRRLSRPSSWVTLQGELGGSRAALSRIFTHMVHLVWARYGPLVSNIYIWKSFFADFAAHLEQLGAPFENLIGFVDGKLVPTARPGGNGCVFLNLHDFQTYSGLHRRHGYSYQGLVLPNGIALAWGPYVGSEADSNKLRKSRLLDDMSEICADLGETYMLFGDSAYASHRYFEHVIRNPQSPHVLTRPERLFNALMARFRITVHVPSPPFIQYVLLTLQLTCVLTSRLKICLPKSRVFGGCSEAAVTCAWETCVQDNTSAWLCSLPISSLSSEATKSPATSRQRTCSLKCPCSSTSPWRQLHRCKVDIRVSWLNLTSAICCRMHTFSCF